MKYRTGFVSNSSSASFIIQFESDISKKEIEKLIRKSDSYLDKNWEEPQKMLDFTKNWPEEEPEYIITDETPLKDKVLFDGEFSADTTMFNDWMDVPAWKFIRLLHDGRHPLIRLKQIRQIESEYTSIDSPAQFDPIVWDENRERQREVEKEYIQYLADIGIEITKDEIKNLLL